MIRFPSTIRLARAALAALVLLVAPGGAPGARADELDDMLVQLKAVKDPRLLKPIEDRLRFAVKPEHAPRLLAAIAPPSPITTPILLDLVGERADGPATVPLLQKYAKPDPPWFEARVLGALARLGDPSALPRLAERTEDGRIKASDRAVYVAAIGVLAVRGDEDYRMGALTTLTRLRVKEGLGALLDGLTDPVADNRRTAMDGVLGTLEAMYPYLAFDAQALGYEVGGDPDARRRKAEALRAWMPTIGIPPPFLKSLKSDQPPPKTTTETGKAPEGGK
jgi:HEAT repeat protein